MSELIDIKSLNIEELQNYLLKIGEKKFRAAQIFTWLHQKSALSFDEMSNLGKTLIQTLKADCELIVIKEVVVQTSSSDQTKKFLFELPDGQRIETVFMPYNYGNSICISSQAGCKMGCKFCASTIGGLVRQLKPSEMLEQIYAVERQTGEKISNIVIMGTGEPFDNFENMQRFLELINAKEGRNIGQRNITVSTCGLVPEIRRFADLDLQVNLAISLHAPDDEIRKKMMPIAQKYSMEELIDACHYYIKKTNRRITFEYSMIQDVNDSSEMAVMLGRRLKGMLCHVNLIPVNPVEGRAYDSSNSATIQFFKQKLEKQGINTTIRRSLGTDVDAACGQLRRSHSHRVD